MYRLEIHDGSTATSLFVWWRAEPRAHWKQLHHIVAPSEMLCMVELGKWAQEQIDTREKLVEQLTGKVSKREQTARELEAAEWPGVAGDVRDGFSSDTILGRLAAIDESESEAAYIVAQANLPTEVKA